MEVVPDQGLPGVTGLVSTRSSFTFFLSPAWLIPASVMVAGFRTNLGCQIVTRGSSVATIIIALYKIRLQCFTISILLNNN